MRRPHHVSSREIERKFLLRRLPDRLKRSRHLGRSRSREECEIKLSPKQFAALWPATAGRRLRKLRYEIPWRNLLIEIDIYRGRHSGLVVAEVEFSDHVTCRKFKPPSWFGREVTGEKRYSNVRLANE